MNEICKNVREHPPVVAKVRILIENNKENVVEVKEILKEDAWAKTTLKINFYGGIAGYPCFICDEVILFDPYIRITTPPEKSSLLSSVDNHERCHESLLFASIAPLVKSGSYAIYISEDGAIHRFDFNCGLLWYSFHKENSFVYASFAYGAEGLDCVAKLGMAVDKNGVANEDPELGVIAINGICPKLSALDGLKDAGISGCHKKKASGGSGIPANSYLGAKEVVIDIEEEIREQEKIRSYMRAGEDIERAKEKDTSPQYNLTKKDILAYLRVKEELEDTKKKSKEADLAAEKEAHEIGKAAFIKTWATLNFGQQKDIGPQLKENWVNRKIIQLGRQCGKTAQQEAASAPSEKNKKKINTEREKVDIIEEMRAEAGITHAPVGESTLASSLCEALRGTICEAHAKGIIKRPDRDAKANPEGTLKKLNKDVKADTEDQKRSKLFEQCGVALNIEDMVFLNKGPPIRMTTVLSVIALGFSPQGTTVPSRIESVEVFTQSRTKVKIVVNRKHAFHVEDCASGMSLSCCIGNKFITRLCHNQMKGELGLSKYIELAALIGAEIIK